jgi:hypothetical protein
VAAVDVYDDFLSPEEFQEMHEDALQAEYLWIERGDETKEAWPAAFPKTDLIKLMYAKLVEHRQKSITNIVDFYRFNTEEHDTALRIHNDVEILGQTPTHAGVFYLSNQPPEHDWDSGTAFWEHVVHGKEFPVDGSMEEQHRLLRDDSGDQSKWTFHNMVHYRQNRLLIYPARRFHSRHPSKSWGTTLEDGRLVFVMFFKEETP